MVKELSRTYNDSCQRRVLASFLPRMGGERAAGKDAQPLVLSYLRCALIKVHQDCDGLHADTRGMRCKSGAAHVQHDDTAYKTKFLQKRDWYATA